jgi:uncharacterized protein YgiM (DUF1202 family)
MQQFLSRRQFLLRSTGVAAGAALTGAGLIHPFIASADTSIRPGDTVRVADGPLNLRSGPGLDYGIKEALATGTQLLVGDGPEWADNYTWVWVMDAPTGWVASNFLEKVHDGNPPRFVVSDGPLNVRQGAGLDAAILGVVSTGEEGISTTQESVQADGYMWAAVAFDSGLRGWIALDFVKWY